MIFHYIVLDLVSVFGNIPKGAFKKILLDLFLPGGGLIKSIKILFKHLKFGMVVNWPNNLFLDVQIFSSELKKMWFKRSLKSDFEEKLLDS